MARASLPLKLPANCITYWIEIIPDPVEFRAKKGETVMVVRRIHNTSRIVPRFRPGCILREDQYAILLDDFLVQIFIENNTEMGFHHER